VPAPEGGNAGQSVSVIVCAYSERRFPLLRRAIRSVGAQTRRAEQVVVVVDHNRALAERCRRELDGVDVVENVVAPGLSGARNTGLRVARCPTVAFLDDDAVAEPTWLERIAAGYEDPAQLGVGGSTVPMWERRRPGWSVPELDWVFGCSYAGQPAVPQRVRNMFGGNASFRRDVVDEVGGFPAALGRRGADWRGCEETELCIRAGRHRPHGYFVRRPDAVIHHLVPVERARLGYVVRRCLGEGLSKGRLATRVGIASGTSTERDYLSAVVAGAFRRDLRRAVAGEARAAVRIAVLGVSLTAAAVGFAIGVVASGGKVRGA
jgi:glycosyltransferase involved in cell wall biosynthesis